MSQPSDVLQAIRNANTQSGQFGITAIIAGLVTSTAISTIVFIIFSILRPRHKLVYAPKLKYASEKQAPPPIGNGMFSWLKPVWQYSDEYLLDRIGLDAVLFLRFWRMCRNIFICLAIGSAAIIPFNIVVGLKTVGGQANVSKNNPLGLLSIEGITQSYLWMQIVFCWIYDGVVIFWLYKGYIGMIALRRKFFHSVEYQGSMNARTLMVIDVPKPSRTDQGLAQLASRFKPDTIHYTQAHIGRDMGELPELLEQHENAVKRLEKYLAVYLKNPDKLPDQRPTCKPKGKQMKIDAIDYYTEQIHTLEARIEAARQAISSRKTTQYGFVSHSTIPSAHIVAKSSKGKQFQGSSVALAPRPTDILWKNLSIPKARRATNRVIGNLLFFALTVAWTVPNALIATFVTNLYNLGAFWPAFGAELNRHTKFWAILQGFLGPIILALFFLLLPTVMRRLTAWGGALTKSDREKSVIHKLYFFFVLNNIVIFTLFGIVWGLVAQVYTVQSQTGNQQSLWQSIKDYHILDNMSHAIIQTSSFWIMYLIARLYVSMLDLAQVFSLIYKTIRKQFNPTPRELIEWTSPLTFDFASYYNYALFYVTIAMSYATIAPLVSPFALLYFTISYGVHKYDMMYVYFTRNETGGSMWRILFNRLLFATGFANAILFAVVFVNYNWQHAVVILPLLPILIGFKLYCWKKFDRQFDYFIPDTDNLDQESSPVTVHQDTSRNKLRNRFGHPAWTKPLFTPMVHAKAEHLLPTVYHGRMRDDEEQGYSSNYPQNMGGGIGKVEVVAEQDLDYENFRNRPDFDSASLMDNSTVVGDNMSILSVPYKDSRPSTPSRMPLNPPVPGYASRSESPLRTGSPVGRTDDYFARAPTRETYGNASVAPGYNPGYTPSDVYELNSLSESLSTRSYERRDPNDMTSLLPHGSGQSRDPSPMGRGGYM